jgi:hypothetical protein
MGNFDYSIGIDCGTNTGFAVWSAKEMKFVKLVSIPIHRALFEVKKAFDSGKNLKVYIEDARLRKWFGANSNSKLQGAGSVKRDSTIWEDFCKDYNIPYQLVSPKENKTKLDVKQFKIYTKYEGKTNEHSRDAGMLVFQRR